MNLIVNKVMQLEIIHISDCYRIIKRLAGASVIKLGLGVTCERYSREIKTRRILILIIRGFGSFFSHGEALSDIVLMRAVKNRRADIPAERSRGVAKVYLEHLTDIHTGRNAQRVKNYIKRGAVRQERHILARENTGNNALVAVTSRHFIADRNLTLLCYIAAHDNINSGA